MLVGALAAIARCANGALPHAARYHGQPLCASLDGVAYVQMMEAVFVPEIKPDMIMEKLAELYTLDGTWLQIGANTLEASTNTNDPFMSVLPKLPLWRKVFVEPVPSLYAQLAANVAKWPNSIAVNAALSVTGEHDEAQETMWCMEGSLEPNYTTTRGLPHWTNQICSFSPSHITKHFTECGAPCANRTPMPVNVTSLSVPRFLEKYKIENVRVLMVDAEGFDYGVLRQFPFGHGPGGMRPTLVVWEHKHLKDRANEAASALMRRHCYMVWQWGQENTMAMSMSL